MPRSRKQRMEGFQKPLANPDRVKAVGLAVVSYVDGQAHCSCGWATHHERGSVIEDRIDRHFNKKHNGRGIRL